MTHYPSSHSKRKEEKKVKKTHNSWSLISETFTVTSDGFLLAGGGCGGGPRLAADVMDEPDVDPLSVLGFHDVSVEGVRFKPPGLPPVEG